VRSAFDRLGEGAARRTGFITTRSSRQTMMDSMLDDQRVKIPE
jgi:hypothetical protein